MVKAVAPQGGIRLGGRPYREGEPLPESYFLTAADARRDPGRAAAGPPNMGRFVIPHALTFQGVISTLSRVYTYSDEAMRESIQLAHMMMTDPVITSPLLARQRMTALLNWTIESEDDDDAELKAVADEIKKCVARIPRFTEMRRALGEAIWYGRYGVQLKYGRWQRRDGKVAWVPVGWTPISGDKLCFRMNDGRHRFDPDQIGVRMSYAGGATDDIAGQWTLEPTQHGMAYFLQPWERALFVVHRHMIRDGEFEDPFSAGAVHGVGLRSLLFWVWYQKQETMARLVEIVERTGAGITIYFYPEGNPKAKSDVDEIAKQTAHSNVIVMPSLVDSPDAYRVENIPPNTAGLQALHDLMEDYFGNLLTRAILGQTLSSKAGATGLGSGVADLQKDSLYDIVHYDAVNLEETITTDVVRVIRDFNFHKYRNVDFYFRISTQSSAPEQELAAIRQAWDMGAKIRTSDVMDRLNLALPRDGEPFLINPQYQQPPAGAMGGGLYGAPGMAEAGLGQSPGAPGMEGDEPFANDARPATSRRGDPAVIFGPILNRRQGQPARYYTPRPKLRQVIAQAAAETDPDPTPEQAAAGNYRKGKFWWNGYEVSIETPAGATRRGKGWERVMQAHYGYLRRTLSERDGDAVDVFIGPNPESPVVYVVDQVAGGGRFDEHKCLIGWTSLKEAREAYKAHYPADWTVGKITPLTVQQFAQWLKHGSTKKPLAEQVHKYSRRGKPAAETLWREDDHPRDESGKFTTTEKAKPGRIADEPFRLEPPKKPWRGDTGAESHKGRQETLWHGLRDKPGQGQLFGEIGKGTQAEDDDAAPQRGAQDELLVVHRTAGEGVDVKIAAKRGRLRVTIGDDDPETVELVDLEPAVERDGRTYVAAAGRIAVTRQEAEAIEQALRATRPKKSPALFARSGETWLYAAKHAPKGGITIAGKQYRGGEFIPDEALAAATEEQRAQIDAGEAPPTSTLGSPSQRRTENRLRALDDGTTLDLGKRGVWTKLPNGGWKDARGRVIGAGGLAMEPGAEPLINRAIDQLYAPAEPEPDPAAAEPEPDIPALVEQLGRVPVGGSVAGWTRKETHWTDKTGAAVFPIDAVAKRKEVQAALAENPIPAPEEPKPDPAADADASPAGASPDASQAGGKGPAAKPKQRLPRSLRGKLDLSKMSRSDKDSLAVVAGMYGINPGDAKNLERAANFSLLAARKLGLNPRGADKTEQTAHAVRYLARHHDSLQNIVSAAEQMGYKGRAQSLVERSRGAIGHIVKQAERTGYISSGRFDRSNLMGALSHLENAQQPAAGQGSTPYTHQELFGEVVKALANKMGGRSNLALAVSALVALWAAHTFMRRT